MILPDNEECRRVLDALVDEPHLSDWEREFVDNNEWRKTFSDAQREVIGHLKEVYEV